MRFSGLAATTFAVGQVLASQPTDAAPQGLLRRVDDVRAEGDTLVLETVVAALDEALVSGRVHLETELRAEDVAEVSNLGLAGTVRLAAPSATRASDDDAFIDLEFDRVLLGSRLDPDNQLRIDGRIRIDPVLTFDATVSLFRPNEVLARIDVGERSELRLTGTFTREIEEELELERGEVRAVEVRVARSGAPGAVRVQAVREHDGVRFNAVDVHQDATAAPAAIEVANDAPLGVADLLLEAGAGTALAAALVQVRVVAPRPDVSSVALVGGDGTRSVRQGAGSVTLRLAGARLEQVDEASILGSPAGSAWPATVAWTSPGPCPMAPRWVRSMTRALSLATVGDEVLLLAGTYSAATGETWPGATGDVEPDLVSAANLPAGVTLRGVDRDGVVLTDPLAADPDTESVALDDATVELLDSVVEDTSSIGITASDRTVLEVVGSEVRGANVGTGFDGRILRLRSSRIVDHRDVGLYVHGDPAVIDLGTATNPSRNVLTGSARYQLHDARPSDRTVVMTVGGTVLGDEVPAPRLANGPLDEAPLLLIDGAGNMVAFE